MCQLRDSINFSASLCLVVDAGLTPSYLSLAVRKLQCGGSIRTLETQTMTHGSARLDMATVQSAISDGDGCAGRWAVDLIGVIHTVK